MKTYKYDLHSHSCLSPCGDNDMSPNNMVNMASIQGCDILAVSDHNSCKNAPALFEIAKEVGVLLVPAMELCTVEEAHILCLFASLERAMDFDEYVSKKLPPVKNKEAIFGNQFIMDKNDNIIGKEEKLLITAADISACDITALMNEFNGVAIPAHIDKNSYSLLASLGTIPKEYNFSAIELSKNCNHTEFLAKNRDFLSMPVLRNSDAHYLEDLCENMGEISLDNLKLESLIEKIRTKAF